MATSVGQIGLDLTVNQNQFKKQMSGITSLAKKAGAALAAAFAVSCLWNAGRNRYPVSSLLWWVTACQPNGSLSIETYSAALCCVD